MTVTIVVTSENVLVNNKKLHEVSLPECINTVFADGGPDMSYEFLRGKKVFELAGSLNNINTAIKYFTPALVNIDKIEKNDQIPEIPFVDKVIIRYISPQVNLDLFNNRYNIFISHRAIKQPQITIVDYFKQFEEFYSVYKTRNVIPEGLAEWKSKVVPQMRNLIEAAQIENNSLIKLWSTNQHKILGLIPQDEFDSYCSDYQKAQLRAIEHFADRTKGY